MFFDVMLFLDSKQNLDDQWLVSDLVARWSRLDRNDSRAYVCSNVHQRSDDDWNRLDVDVR